jgi:hypothetical protein
MKKFIVLMLSVLMLLSLCACGGEETPAEEMNLNVAPKVEATAPKAEEIPVAATEAPKEETAEKKMQEMKALAESCIDKDVNYLYELIGKPNSADYAPSCLVQGGEDGMLYYDGFVVYTTREGDVETVYYVE